MTHPEHDEPRYQFCPVCGGTLEPRLLKVGDPERLVCAGCRFVMYRDPKVAVGTIIRMDDRIVLVRRSIEPGRGRWVFPGGYVDRGEPIETAAVREAREECGLDVRLDQLINVYSYPNLAPVVIVFAATAVGGSLAVEPEECLEAALFEAAQIPWNDLAFLTTSEALRDYLSGQDAWRRRRH